MTIWFTCEDTSKGNGFCYKKKCVAISYHSELFKTAVTVKEIINLKYEIDNKFSTKIKKDYSKKNMQSRAYEWMSSNKTKCQMVKWRCLGMNKILPMQKTIKVV